MSRRTLKPLLLPAALFCLNPLLLAQGIATGSLSGVVTDSSGALLPGAVITVTDLAKGIVQTTKTGSNGDFNFLALPVGTYSVSIEQPGFSPLRLPMVNINANQDRALGKEALQIGSRHLRGSHRGLFTA